MTLPPSNSLVTIYRLLERAYGVQGWWPLSGRAGRAGYDEQGYHTGQSTAEPLRDDERLEIALGAILTQNIAWENARRAVGSLRDRGLASVDAILSASQGELAAAIRASGYFNQKAKKLRYVAELFSRRSEEGRTVAPTRSELLALWGIGTETADSILLYAYSKPFFIADAYARRIFERIGVTKDRPGYDRLQQICHEALASDSVSYGEYHALLVRHARHHCMKIPRCGGCPLARICDYRRGREA